jgi:hypothetical protein
VSSGRTVLSAQNVAVLCDLNLDSPSPAADAMRRFYERWSYPTARPPIESSRWAESIAHLSVLQRGSVIAIIWLLSFAGRRSALPTKGCDLGRPRLKKKIEIAVADATPEELPAGVPGSRAAGRGPGGPVRRRNSPGTETQFARGEDAATRANRAAKRKARRGPGRGGGGESNAPIPGSRGPVRQLARGFAG